MIKIKIKIMIERQFTTTAISMRQVVCPLHLNIDDF